jgi:hypothetical protein
MNASVQIERKVKNHNNEIQLQSRDGNNICVKKSVSFFTFNLKVKNKHTMANSGLFGPDINTWPDDLVAAGRLRPNWAHYRDFAECRRRDIGNGEVGFSYKLPLCHLGGSLREVPRDELCFRWQIDPRTGKSMSGDGVPTPLSEIQKRRTIVEWAASHPFWDGWPASAMVTNNMARVLAQAGGYDPDTGLANGFPPQYRYDFVADFVAWLSEEGIVTRALIPLQLRRLSCVTNPITAAARLQKEDETK